MNPHNVGRTKNNKQTKKWNTIVLFYTLNDAWFTLGWIVCVSEGQGISFLDSIWLEGKQQQFEVFSELITSSERQVKINGKVDPFRDKIFMHPFYLTLCKHDCFCVPQFHIGQGRLGDGLGCSLWNFDTKII